VGVSVHRVGYLRVSEYFLDDLRILPLLEHPGSEGMPKIVEADRLRQPSLLEERLEVALGEIGPLHRGAGAGREDEVVILPQSWVFEPLFGLALAVTLERSTASDSRETERPFSVLVGLKTGPSGPFERLRRTRATGSGPPKMTSCHLNARSSPGRIPVKAAMA
jgi:hypothetical protein